MCKRLDARGVTLLIAAIPETPRGDRRAAEHTVSGRLVREAFGGDARLGHHATGAPLVMGVPGSVCISLSHSRHTCVLAVGLEDRHIGVDIDAPRPQLGRVFHRFSNPADVYAVPASAYTMLRLWTAKEAVFKAAGCEELTVSRIAVDMPRAKACTPDGTEFSLQWIAADDGQVICVAVKT